MAREDASILLSLARFCESAIADKVMRNDTRPGK
jgi:hypothetical protein